MQYFFFFTADPISDWSMCLVREGGEIQSMCPHTQQGSFDPIASYLESIFSLFFIKELVQREGTYQNAGYICSGQAAYMKVDFLFSDFGTLLFHLCLRSCSYYYNYCHCCNTSVSWISQNSQALNTKAKTEGKINFFNYDWYICHYFQFLIILIAY